MTSGSEDVGMCTLSRWLLVLLIASLVMCTGCEGGLPGGGALGVAEGPIAPSHEPIEFVNPNYKPGMGTSRDKRPVGDAESGFEEKWALASRYAKAGYDDEAMLIIDAALKQQPDEPWGTRLRGLRTTLRMLKTEQELLRAEVRPARDYVLFDERIDLVIRLRNVSAETITLLPPQVAATGRSNVSPTAVVLELKRTDRDISGSELERSWTQTLYLLERGGQSIRIPAGGVYEQHARIPATEVGGHLSGFRTLEIGGTLRTTRLRLGDTDRHVRIPLRAARVSVLPPGYEPLAEAPLVSLRKAIDTVAPVHLLVATEFVASARHVEAVEILALALGTGHRSLTRPAHAALRLIRDRSVGRPVIPLATPLMDALARWPMREHAIMRGLAAVTGVDVAPDRRLWRDWWRRTRAARTSGA